MKYSAALALAGALASVQAQRIDTGFLTGPELTALAGGNFAWGDIEIGDTSIMSLEYILAELDAITGDYPYNYYYPYAYYPPPLTIPRPIPGYPGLVNNVNILMPSATIQYDALTRLANCSTPGGRIEYLIDATGPGVETDVRTQVTFIFPLSVYGKNCQFIFFLGNTSTVTGSDRFVVLQNETPLQSCPTTEPPTIPNVEQDIIGTYQAKFADLAQVVTSTGTFLVGTNSACPAPSTLLTDGVTPRLYTTPPAVVTPPTTTDPDNTDPDNNEPGAPIP
ncbi:hypothetical protein SMACR_08965 [Sordaria macrospora]|uniref:WGS project CABT00000000 data, contig 2.82 n=2 Tax=Sordaria macrospora TaxID=5147 RepID=F7WBP9_SORMK|nr:uncharacterized protein SMAC_08965 [Sordaria macrospora k-hell]KAA8624236.1 hypothetical protein SMACR_08965 [Sordaria macrospora]KAH7635288.1 hypothetical protein B0T09DRAFT_353800 [Sordaria sp. MPI-SDFR-AT-0083]WPJ67237.1 hypothetical protein SMAC4_08965 [Sordaria macrospora]CCC05464.1 unnamed protein product [Sordaria macrospora k-hell]